MVIHKRIGRFLRRKIRKDISRIKKVIGFFTKPPTSSQEQVEQQKAHSPGIIERSLERVSKGEDPGRLPTLTRPTPGTKASFDLQNRAKRARFLSGEGLPDAPSTLQMGLGLAGIAAPIGALGAAGRLSGTVGKVTPRTVAIIPTLSGLIRRVPRGAGAAAAVTGGLFLAEQLAERAGVRGGAGFIGARPAARGRSSRKRLLNKNAMKVIRRAHGLKKQVKKAAQMMGMTVTQRGHRHSQKTILVEPSHHHHSRH